MRPLLFTWLLLLAAIPSLMAQRASSCIPPAGLENSYYNDIADLAMQRMYAAGSPDTVLIDVPQAMRDTVLRAMAAIANLGPQLEADSVLDHYCIHGWPYQAHIPAEIQIQVDTSFPWARAWYNGKTLTGDPRVDALVAAHGVRLTNYFSASPYELLNHWATLRADHAINTRALADSLLRIPGALRSKPGRTIGGGNRIDFQADSFYRFGFYAGWGDCPSGCSNVKVWRYRVDPRSCAVTLDTVYRDARTPEPPVLGHCHPLAVKNPPPSGTALVPEIGPNPVARHLYVRHLEIGTRLRLLDLSGRLIRAWTHNGAGSDLSDLTPGAYMLETLRSGTNERLRFRIVKQ